MVNQGSYSEYTRLALKDFAAYSDAQRYLLVNELAGEKIEKVLDVGCGAGQQLLPFAEKKDSLCVGVDVAEEVGHVGQEVFRQSGVGGKGFFLQSLGEELPFADESFDAVICRVALPYMDNRRALQEISRVMRPQGKFFLKIHAPAFYFGMIRERFKTFSIKQLAYPLICLTGGTLNAVTGKHPQGSFWKGKEVYQTRRLLERELTKNNLHIVKELPDTNPATPSFLIEKA